MVSRRPNSKDILSEKTRIFAVHQFLKNFPVIDFRESSILKDIAEINFRESSCSGVENGI